MPHDRILNRRVNSNAGSEIPLKTILEKNQEYTIRTIVQFLLGYFLFIGSPTVSALWKNVAERLRSERKM